MDHMKYKEYPELCQENAPIKDDPLWNMQFERWWGWNWIKNREKNIEKYLLSTDLLPQKRADKIALYYVNTNSNYNNSRRSINSRDNAFRRNRRDSASIFNNLGTKIKNVNRTKLSEYNDEEKKRLSDLFATPCVSREYVTGIDTQFFTKTFEGKPQTRKQRKIHKVYETSTSSSSCSSIEQHDHVCCCRYYNNTGGKTYNNYKSGEAQTKYEKLDENIQTIRESHDKFTQTYMINNVDKGTEMVYEEKIKNKTQKRQKSKNCCCCRRHCCCCCCCHNKNTYVNEEQKHVHKDVGVITRNEDILIKKKISCHCCELCKGKYAANQESTNRNSKDFNKNIKEFSQQIPPPPPLGHPKKTPKAAHNYQFKVHTLLNPSTNVQEMSYKLRESWYNTNKSIEKEIDNNLNETNDDVEHKILMETILTTILNNRNKRRSQKLFPNFKSSGRQNFETDFESFKKSRDLLTMISPIISTSSLSTTNSKTLMDTCNSPNVNLPNEIEDTFLLQKNNGIITESLENDVEAKESFEDKQYEAFDYFNWNICSDKYSNSKQSLNNNDKFTFLDSSDSFLSNETDKGSL